MKMAKFLGESLLPTRIESDTARAFRLAKYPDGTVMLQGAYAWSSGMKAGIEWRDMPVIDVDANGVALDD